MNRTTTIASRVAILALLAMLASVTSLLAQELRIAIPFDEFGYAAGSQIEGRAPIADVAGRPIFVEPPVSHATYWLGKAQVHPVLKPPVILARPEARYSMWWDSIETVLGLLAAQ